MSNDRWPSPLPGPAWQAWRTAWDHITLRTLAEVPETEQHALLRTTEVQAQWERMSHLAASGDVLATQQAGNRLNSLVKKLVQQREVPV